MKLDFSNIEVKQLKNFFGGEGTVEAQMLIDETHKIMRCVLKPGVSIGMHKHENADEVLYVLQGTATELFDDTEEVLTAGDCHYCPSGHAHSTINNGQEDLVFFAVVTLYK